MDSTFPGQGRLQLTFEGVPGSVGTEEWSDEEAHIACRQMGYASGVTAHSTSAGIQQFYLNKLTCDSVGIKSILQCGNTGWGMNATGLTESASVKCYKHGMSLNVLFKKIASIGNYDKRSGNIARPFMLRTLLSDIVLLYL